MGLMGPELCLRAGLRSESGSTISKSELTHQPVQSGESCGATLCIQYSGYEAQIMMQPPSRDWEAVGR